MTEGDNCEIRVNQDGQAERLIQDILFGDVWVCSGQSNMEWPMGSIFDAEQEIQELAAFDKIRLEAGHTLCNLIFASLAPLKVEIMTDADHF